MCHVGLALTPTLRLLERVKKYGRARFGASGSGCKVDNSLAQKQSRVLHFDVPGTPEMLRVIRNRVVDFARTMPFTEDEVQDIKLAVGEASANAIKHAMPDKCCRVEVKLERQPSALKITISDNGCGFDPNAAKVAQNDRLDESGRGISVMRATMDEVKFSPAHPGTRVELIKRFKR
jgi:serine/threonine-protein kinase RsbW